MRFLGFSLQLWALVLAAAALVAFAFYFRKKPLTIAAVALSAFAVFAVGLQVHTWATAPQPNPLDDGYGALAYTATPAYEYMVEYRRPYSLDASMVVGDEEPILEAQREFNAHRRELLELDPEPGVEKFHGYMADSAKAEADALSAMASAALARKRGDEAEYLVQAAKAVDFTEERKRSLSNALDELYAIERRGDV